LGWPSMLLPIQYGLLYPDRAPTGLEPLDLAKIGSLTFAEPDFRKFPALNLARQALKAGQNYPSALNGANEVAVRSFLNGGLGFVQIAAAVEYALTKHSPGDELDLDAILQADVAARDNAAAYIARFAA
ncbi:MAG: 1-deoxy-D-xylulose-5-phosphate reductoisomerase, partial [Chloroflexi bacterium]|nr:1-deoxy-D-xylulose-5-phosphate reductoisomerase [Chloroflexota bacterium]